MVAGRLTPVVFFFNDTATTEIYTLSLHDALPISKFHNTRLLNEYSTLGEHEHNWPGVASNYVQDRKSTRLNSSHLVISYAVFCLKKKKISCVDVVFDLYGCDIR